MSGTAPAHDIATTIVVAAAIATLATGAALLSSDTRSAG
jgi:hypothetical protein